MSSRTLGLHHILKAAILLGFALYIAHLSRTELILLYIAPRMTDYVKWSALALYAAAMYQFYSAYRALKQKKAPACGCEDHDHTPSRSLFKNTVVYGLFCFPLLLGFMVPDASMGSSLADKKGMNLSSAASVKKESSLAAGSAQSSGDAAAPPPAGGDSGAPAGGPDSAAAGSADAEAGGGDALFPSDKFTLPYAKHARQLYGQEVIKVPEELYIETLQSVDLYLDRFVGKKLELTGFVYRQEDMKPEQFVVGRFSIQCCSADAAPFGVLAEYGRAQTLVKDSWVTITGTIGKARMHDVDIMVLQVEKVAKAEPAKTPYVYPNYEFGT